MSYLVDPSEDLQTAISNFRKAEIDSLQELQERVAGLLEWYVCPSISRIVSHVNEDNDYAS